MIKKVVILHGTDGKPESNWFPWLKAKLEAGGYEVWVPQLPDCDKPNRQTWGDFLFGSDWDFTDNIVVGHSAGAVEVLNLLMDVRFPHIKLCVLVSAWPGGYPEGEWEQGQFDSLFPPEGFNIELIKQNADKLAFVHGDNDPYCPINKTKVLAEQLGVPLMVVPNAGHLSVPELPELWQIIEPEL
jgi:predicted alpha/beta hydrolase family esterase